MISWSLNKAGNAVIHTAAGSCFWPMCDIGMFESIQFLHVSPNSSKTGMGEWMHRRRPELILMNDMHLSQTQRSLELHRLQDLWNPVFIEFLPRCSLTLYIFIAECLSWIDRYQMHVILYIHTMDFHGFPTWSSFPATNLKVSLHHAKSFEKSSESWQVQPTVIIYCLIRQQVPGAWTHAFDSGLLRLLYKYSIIQQFASSTHARMQSACRFWQSDMFRNWNYSVNRTHLFLYNHVPWLRRKPFRV